MPTILHTSDWHLGANLLLVDRAADERLMLDGLAAICAEHSVDAVIIAGDIFDTANPAAGEQRRYFDALLALVQRGGVGTVVVIGGNHDSGARLDCPRQLLESCRVEVRGSLAHDAPPGDALLRLRDRQGREFAVCAAVPYLREGDLRLPPGDDGLALRQARAMQERCHAIREAALGEARRVGLPLVVTGHAFVTGGTPGAGERQVLGQAVAPAAPLTTSERIVGNLGLFDAGVLAEGSAYAAFGHLHRAQRIAGRDHWRYCGSLLPAGFDEIADERLNLVLATLDGDRPAQVQPLALPSPRRYAQVRGTWDAVRAAIAALPPRADGEMEPLLKAIVQIASERPGIKDEVDAWAAANGWRCLAVCKERLPGADTSSPAAASSAAGRTLDELTPLDVLRHAHRIRHHTEAPAAMEAAFATLLAEHAAPTDSNATSQESGH